MCARHQELYWRTYEGPVVSAWTPGGWLRALSSALREQEGLLVSDAPIPARGNR